MLDTKESFLGLGFSKLEADVYLSLLRLGGGTVSRIASELDVQRTRLYPVLRDLSQRGAVRLYFQKNKRFYRASTPNLISRHFQEKLNDFNKIII